MRKITFLTTTFINIAFCFANKLPTLNQNEIKRLFAGEMIIKEKETKESVWPKRRVYSLLDISPLEALAIYAAYPWQKDYVPNVIKSKVTANPSPRETQVDYILKTPWPLPNAVYTHSHLLFKKNGIYTLKWEQVQSNSVDKNMGHVQFFKYRGRTVMSYYSLISPQSIFAKFFKERAKEDLLSTLESIIDYMHTTKVKRPDVLEKQMQKVEDAFAGRYPYKDQIKILP